MPYTFTNFDIRVHDSHQPTYCLGINNSGKIVGYFGTGPGGMRGFVSTVEDDDVSVLEFPSAKDTLAYDINASGVTCGTYTASVNFHDRLHGFLFKDGTYKDLSENEPPNIGNVTVRGINDAGKIVGWYGVDASRRQGFLFDGTDYTTLDYGGETHGPMPLITQTRLLGCIMEVASLVVGFSTTTEFIPSLISLTRVALCPMG